MEYIYSLLWMIFGVVALLGFSGLQRIFFPHTIANGYMDIDKLKTITPELFEKDTTNSKKGK